MIYSRRYRFVKSYACVGLMLFLSAHVPGCQPPPVVNDGGGDFGSEPIELSTQIAKIGEFVAIRHFTIEAGKARTVSFQQDDGVVQEIEVIPHTDGELSVPAPPVVNADGGAITAGRFGISIDGVNATADLMVEDLYTLDGIETGTVLEIFINSTLADIEDLLAKLDAGDDGFSTEGERTAFRNALLENQAYYEGLLDEWNTNQTLTFETAGSENTVVGSDELRTAERLLTNLLIGSHNEILRRNNPTDSRIIGGNCIGSGLSGDALTACLMQCVDDVKASALQASQVAGVLPAAVGATVTLFGIFVVGSEAVIVTGVIVTAAGMFHGFTTAYAANENTDTFGQNEGEGFSASREAISQVVRYGANAGAAPVSLALNAKDFAAALEAAKCGEGAPDQRVRIAPEDIEFCENIGGELFGAVNTDITSRGGGSASSRFSADFGVALGLDGNSFTSWFSDGDNGGTNNSEVFTWQLAESGDVIISRVETDPEQFEGGGKFGFAGGTLQIINSAGQTTFSRDLSFPASRVDINQDIPEGTRGRTVQLILVNHQDETCGGFAEMRVFGRSL